MKVDIAPFRDLLYQLKDPQKRFRAIHIAARRKRICGRLNRSWPDRAGLACGRFSSPHVERITERVTFGGQEISESMLARMLNWAWLVRERALLRSEPVVTLRVFDLETLAAIIASLKQK